MQASHVRRSQAERREATRRALLDATFESLAVDGYSATTVTEVARRAGVSVGALQHHFPAKADLVAAALQDVYERRQSEFVQRMSAVPANVDRLDAAVDVLWDLFQGPTFAAWAELWIAARTDPELAAELAPVERGFTETAETIFANLLAPAEDPANRELALAFTFAVLVGVSMYGLHAPHVSPPSPPQAVVDALKVMGRHLIPRPS
jgi:AcrR family transcriptional regulator